MIKLHKLCEQIIHNYILKVKEVSANFENKLKEQKKQMKGKLLSNLLLSKVNYTTIAAI